jgi:hypothetical protein
MNTPLSQNELEILDRQIGKLNYQLGEIAALLESRLGKAHETAVSARTIQQSFDRFAHRMHQPASSDSGLSKAASATTGTTSGSAES